MVARDGRKAGEEQCVLQTPLTVLLYEKGLALLEAKSLTIPDILTLGQGCFIH